MNDKKPTPTVDVEGTINEIAEFIVKNTPYLPGTGSVGVLIADHVRKLLTSTFADVEKRHQAELEAQLASVAGQHFGHSCSAHSREDCSFCIGADNFCDELFDKLQPSPCNVPGHRMVDWVSSQVMYTDGTPSRDVQFECLRCAELERARQGEGE